MFRHFQHRLAISPTSLHTIAVIMVVAWVLAPKGTFSVADTTQGIWYLVPDVLRNTGVINTMSAILAAVMAIYILGELNISQVLLRVNSRAVSFTFAALMGTAISLHAFHPGMIVMLCVLMSYFTLFSSYQIDDSATLTYITFLYLGIGVLALPKMLWIAPIYWLSLYILRSINARSVLASVLGLLTPLWILGSIAYCINKAEVFTNLLGQVVHFTWGGYTEYSTSDTIIVWICFAVFFIGFVDLYTRLNLDKTRTRIVLLVTGIHGFAIYLLLLLQPLSLHSLLPVAIVPTAIMGGHYVANDPTPLSNVIVWVLTVCIVATLALQIWIL